MENVGFKEWGDLKESFLRRLDEIKYSPSRIKLIRNTLTKIEAFMTDWGIDIYHPGIGEKFLARESDLVSESYHLMQKTAINRLADFLEGCEFKRRVRYIKKECPRCFRKEFDLYVGELKSRGLRASSITRYSKLCIEGLSLIRGFGVKAIPDIKPKHITKAFEAISDKPTFITACGNLLKYLYSAGFHEKDLSFFIPKIKKPQQIPSVYSRDEVNRMIAAIDKTTSIGKRDYAVFLLALRLGIRRGDISNLKLADIDFVGKRIRFVQEKTRVPQNLLLPDDVGAAIAEYIKTARPETRLPYVFLTVKAPVSRLRGVNLYKAVNKYITKAGIGNDGRKRGPRSMRMTLASELISEKTPYGVVKHILGQESPESTRHYIKFDIETLRACAIAVPEPIGLLAERLNPGKGAR